MKKSELNEDLLGCLPTQITSEMNINFEREVTRDKVQNVAFQLGGNRAPYSDGFSGMFYQMNWHIVGSDIFTAIKSFFRSGAINSIVKQINVTIIPKVPSLTREVDF